MADVIHSGHGSDVPLARIHHQITCPRTTLMVSTHNQGDRHEAL